MPSRGAALGEPDRAAFRRGFFRVCGIDEAGRGPLAGPVVAAAVVLSPGTLLPGLDDSKRLAARSRAALVPRIRDVALGVGVGIASAAEIDQRNILRASLLAMARAVEALPEHVRPDLLLVDGVHRVPLAIAQETLVGGDGRSTAIAAASVVAKEHRDALMREFALSYPGYGFEIHKGYPTELHRQALGCLGPCPIHRASFRGVLGAVAPAPRLACL